MNLLTSILPLVLPATGGEGNAFVTIVGLSMAGVAILLFAIKLRAGRRKPKQPGPPPRRHQGPM